MSKTIITVVGEEMIETGTYRLSHTSVIDGLVMAHQGQADYIREALESKGADETFLLIALKPVKLPCTATRQISQSGASISCEQEAGHKGRHSCPGHKWV